MKDHTPTSSQTSRALGVVALLLTVVSLLWYGSQVLRFGFAFDMVDLIGGYFAVSCIAVLIVLRTEGNRVGESGFLFLVCALAIPAFVLFSGQFLSTFDPRSGVGDRVFPYLLRGLFLGAAGTTLFAIGPRRFLDIPRWLLVLACIVTAGWLFVYACPSIVREWYGTRSAPSELFPEGMLMFDRRNPERGIQGQMLFASAVAWLVVIIVGRIRYRRVDGRSIVPQGETP